MEEEGYHLPLLAVANNDGLIQSLHGMTPVPQNAANPINTAISWQQPTVCYATISQSYSSQGNDLQHRIDHEQPLHARVGIVTTVQDDNLAEAEIWQGQWDQFFSYNGLSRCGLQWWWMSVLLETHHEQHQLRLFAGNLKLVTSNHFICKVEHSLCRGEVKMGTTQSDKDITSAWQFMDHEGHSWFAHWICQQGVMVIAPANGLYAQLMWHLLKCTFLHHFFPEVAITAFPMKVRALHDSRAVGEVAHFTNLCSKHIHILENASTITHDDHLHDEYFCWWPVCIADPIITAAHIQMNLQPGTPFMWSNAIAKVAEFSECTTPHPAVTSSQVNHGTNVVLPQAAPSPTPIGPGPIYLNVANTHNSCYGCHSFAQEVRDCATPDIWVWGQPFHGRPSGNLSTEDGGDDSIDIHCGNLGTSARSGARSIDNIQQAAVEDAHAHSAGMVSVAA